MSALFASAAVSVLILVVLVLILIILVLILVLVLILILVLILVIHKIFPPKIHYGLAAILACPVLQDLSLALKMRLAARPAVMAAVMPPALALRPPVKIPIKPCS